VQHQGRRDADPHPARGGRRAGPGVAGLRALQRAQAPEGAGQDGGLSAAAPRHPGAEADDGRHEPQPGMVRPLGHGEVISSLEAILKDYDAEAPLDRAFTIPAPWYVDPGVYELEKKAVFGGWQVVGRLDPVEESGDFFTAEVAGEPLVVTRGRDGVVRAFFNVCRHHAAAVATEEQGQAASLRCPYHGWTYSLEGELRGTPDFDGVCDFDRAKNGL